MNKKVNKLKGRGLMKTSHLGLSALKSLTLHIVQLCISVLITLYCKEKLLQWRLNGGLSSE